MILNELPLTFRKLVVYDQIRNNNPSDLYYQGIKSKLYQTNTYHPVGHFRPISKVLNLEIFTPETEEIENENKLFEK